MSDRYGMTLGFREDLLGYSQGTNPFLGKKITLQPLICKDIKKQLRRDSNPCFSLERAAS